MDAVVAEHAAFRRLEQPDHIFAKHDLPAPGSDEEAGRAVYGRAKIVVAPSLCLAGVQGDPHAQTADWGPIGGLEPALNVQSTMQRPPAVKHGKDPVARMLDNPAAMYRHTVCQDLVMLR